jgi:hypothetical protein
MKVLDLACSQQHLFEGWFASEDDFASQCRRGLVQCPVCGDPTIVKKLSAPRLNLSGAREPQAPKQPSTSPASPAAPARMGEVETALAAAWMAVARHVVANTTDVGNSFAEEARKIHYGEAQARNIRGQTTPEQARELVEEGIEVMPLMLPDAVKETLQ